MRGTRTRRTVEGRSLGSAFLGGTYEGYVGCGADIESAMQTLPERTTLLLVTSIVTSGNRNTKIHGGSGV